MFNIKFESEYKTTASFGPENVVKFDPPVYEQRYSAVLRCLQLERWSSHFKKIVEFGCAEMRLLVFLKSLPGVEHILQVDIDESLLVRNLFKAEPLICDYLRQREKQLQIDVYCGSIDAQNDCLLNTDVVIGIEVIEHLYPDTVENLPYNIFGFMKPKIALFTTPNSDCNVLFKMTEKFRHDDHKFEWTQKQFEDWGTNICVRFPDYKVAFYGIGAGPIGTKEYGCCSQMALFVRADFLELTSTDCDIIEVENEYQPLLAEAIQMAKLAADEKILNNSSVDQSTLSRSKNDVVEDMIEDLTKTHIATENYRLIRSCVYPRSIDDRSREQKIFDEATFHLSRYMNLDDDHYDPDANIIKVPVLKIFELVYKFTSDINEFRHVMRENNYTIDANDVFLIKPIETDNSEEEYYEEFPRAVNAVGAESEEEDWD